MASYYVTGYSTPSGVESREEVKQYQRMLGVTADGIWGPVTQAAYEKYNAADPFAGNGGAFSQYYQAVRDAISVPGISVTVPSREMIKRDYEEALRPSVDLAIEQRRVRGEEMMAEMDADAASRGMGASTYISSMKEREGDDVESDVSMMETQYTSALAERIAAALQYYASLEMQAANANAQMEANANNTALSIASQWYQNYLAGLAPNRSSPASRGTDKSEAAGAFHMSEDGYLNYLSTLSAQQRSALFNSSDGYWSTMRNGMIAAMGQARYDALKRSYMHSTGTRSASTGGRLWQANTK